MRTPDLNGGTGGFRWPMANRLARATGVTRQAAGGKTVSARLTRWRQGAGAETTLAGGTDAMRQRITEWQAAIRSATGREAAEGGVSLVFDHAPGVAVELARDGGVPCYSFFIPRDPRR